MIMGVASRESNQLCLCPVAMTPPPPPPPRPAGADLRAALDAVLAGKAAAKARPSIGCNIKWHPGKEPSYYGAQLVKK